MAGENLDLINEVVSVESEERGREPQRFLGVHFACCGVYARVYTNRARTAYVGYCPKCGQRVQFRVGTGGSDCRFFTAY